MRRFITSYCRPVTDYLTGPTFSVTLLLLCIAAPSFAGDTIKPAQPWAGAALDDWANASKAILITDLSRCQPKSALSDMVLKRNRWKVIPYRLDNDVEGKMIWAPPEANSPEVSLAPKLEGWYAVFVGLFATLEAPTMAWIRLDDDPSPLQRYNKRADYGNTEEVFFRAVHLRKNSKLLFRPQTTGEVSPCGITHVKFIPLTEDEVRTIEAERKDQSHRVLSATNDGNGDMFHYSPRTKSELLSFIDLFKDTDFGTLILQAPGADKTNYPSRVGHMMGSNTDVHVRAGDRHFVEAARALAEKKINPVEAQIKRAHEIGMKVHVAFRPAGWSFFEPYADLWETPFYKQHPEWRCEDRDGTPVTRMSWAVPEVRRHMIELEREMVRFGADGASIIFTRGYPVVLYEKPARELFQKQYQVDPREIPESDPRINKFRTDIVTTFFEELRAMLDEEGRRRGKGSPRLALSVLISASGPDDFDDLVYGVDLKRLVNAKLVDEVFTEHGFGAASKDFNLDFLRETCKPMGVPFSPGIYKGVSGGKRPYSLVPAYYDNGAHGVCVWDAEILDIYDWCWMSRFGHPEETRWRLENLDLNKPPRSIHTFHKLGDQVRNGRFGPQWGG
ncbi:MAG: hypothetical protein WD468_12920 [Pirellulales bacterium]